MGLSNEWEWQDEALIAKADGRIDGTNAREFQEALETVIKASDKVMTLDLERLSYISSAGLRVILLAAKELCQQDTKFAVCSLSNSIREVFEISGFDQIIPVHASLAEAIAALKD